MGVPGFFHWLVKRYPLISRRMDGASRPRFDCFFIDFNCIIYSAMRKTKTADDDEIKTELMSEVLRYLDVLVQIIKPTSLLFIGLDGPAPFAKCTQQRSRRFMRERGSTEISEFSSNAISIGTIFMDNLHKKLTKFIQDRVRNDPIWGTPDVIYSSCYTPGEGEHKFFDFIRDSRSKGKWNENAVCCVYSPDADLVFICLQSHIKHISILRESENIFSEIKLKRSVNDSGLKHSPCDFVLVHMSLLREYMAIDFQIDQQHLGNVIDDFSAISFLIGNDFIPHFPDVSIQKGDFSIVIEIYKKYVRESRFIVDGDSFNKGNLAKFLLEVSVVISQTKNQSLTYENLIMNAEQKLHTKYNEEYTKDPDTLKAKLSYSVMDAFTWVLRYYKYGCPSWSWYFPFHYVPSLIIVSQYVESYEPNFDLGSPPLPLVQLLSILPPQNVNFLPQALRHLMDPDSPIADLYPLQFRLDRNGQKTPSNGVVVIPFVDQNRINEVFNQLADQLTPEEKERNVIIPPSLVRPEEIVFYDSNNMNIRFRLFDSSPNPPCIPSLHSIPLELNPTFSSDGTLVLKHQFQNKVNYQMLQTLIGNSTLVGWPYFVPATVTSIEKYNQNAHKGLISSYMSVYGLDISNTLFFIKAKMLNFENHDLSLYYLNEEVLFPFQLTAAVDSQTTLKRYVLPSIPCLNLNQIVCEVSNSIGTLGKVESIKGKVVQYHRFPSYNIKNIPSIIQADCKEWKPIVNFANQFRILPELMNKVFSDIHTEKYRQNIGLGMIKEIKGVAGFCKSTGAKFNSKSVLVSVDCLQILEEYFTSAKPLLETLQRIQSIDQFEEMYNQMVEQQDENYLTLVGEWIKEYSPKESYPMGKMYQPFAARGTIRHIEEALKDFNFNLQQQKTKAIKTTFNNLIWQGKLNTFHFRPKIGDRVICVPPSGLLPFGTIGTIIGLSFNFTIAHIITDQETPYGNTMYGHLQTRRGCICAVNDLIKLC